MQKIILLEGIPGSGKSTTARFLSIQLERNGLKPVLFHETTADHPIFLRDDIHNPDNWMETYLNNWMEFLTKKTNENTIIVMESALIQNPILNLLNKDEDRKRIRMFISELATVVNEYEASLIFFYQEDSVSAIDNMIESRGGSQFLSQKYEEFKGEKYYLNRENKGPELHLDFLKEYADISRDLINRRMIKTLSIENSKGEWELYEDQILEQYHLTRIMDPQVAEDELVKYVGTFHNDEMNFTIQIEIRDENLYVFGNKRLKCRRKNTFYLDDMSVDISFFEDEGVFNKLVIGEKDIFANRDDEGTTFVRIS